MPKLTKIYTRTGDDGTTALGTKSRVGKDTIRVSAYGEIDELNSILGIALASGLSPGVAAVLPGLQHELFNLGSQLAFPPSGKETPAIPIIEKRHVDRLEVLIDHFNRSLPSLENFILPGGAVGAAHLQHARAVCRRAERGVVALARNEPTGEFVLPYLNRLSDALFVMARAENQARNVDEPIWNTHS